MSAFSPQKRTQFRCPFCDTPLVRRTSWLAHIFMRQELYQCDMPVCGASFNGTTELTHIASPTGMPHAPECALPESPHYLRELARRAYKQNAGEAQMDLLDQPLEEQNP